MATCKNCLHNDACVDMLQALGFTVDGAGCLADKRCRIFKDKNEYSKVVHGRWDKPSKYGLNHKFNHLGAVCSACACYCDNLYNYCPHCGAKMDGGIDDGDTR